MTYQVFKTLPSQTLFNSEKINEVGSVQEAYDYIVGLMTGDHHTEIDKIEDGVDGFCCDTFNIYYTVKGT